MSNNSRLAAFIALGAGVGLILIARFHQPLGIAFGVLIGLVIGKLTERSRKPAE